MNRDYHPHDISDNGKEKIKPHTIGERDTRRGRAKKTRQFINGMFWILRTGKHLGETFRQNTDIEKMFIYDSFFEEIDASGKIF